MIEEMKAMMQDDSVHVFIGQITRLHVDKDEAYLKVEVEVWPELRKIICMMTWEMVGPNSGFYSFPVVGDMILGVSAEGDVDQSFVIKRLSTKEDNMPKNAISGDMVMKSLAGKNLWLTSDTKINLSKGDDAPTENVVLGQIFKTFAGELLDLVAQHALLDSTHTHSGNLGYQTGPPVQTADYVEKNVEYTELKASPIEDEAILSDLTFTEK